MQFGQITSAFPVGTLGAAATGDRIYDVHSQVPQSQEGFEHLEKARNYADTGLCCQVKLSGATLWTSFTSHRDAEVHIYGEIRGIDWIGRLLSGGNLISNEWCHDPDNADTMATPQAGDSVIVHVRQDEHSPVFCKPVKSRKGGVVSVRAVGTSIWQGGLTGQQAAALIDVRPSELSSAFNGTILLPKRVQFFLFRDGAAKTLLSPPLPVVWVQKDGAWLPGFTYNETVVKLMGLKKPGKGTQEQALVEQMKQLQLTRPGVPLPMRGFNIKVVAQVDVQRRVVFGAFDEPEPTLAAPAPAAPGVLSMFAVTFAKQKQALLQPAASEVITVNDHGDGLPESPKQACVEVPLSGKLLQAPAMLGLQQGLTVGQKGKGKGKGKGKAGKRKFGSR
jgi:hypothetical protein